MNFLVQCFINNHCKFCTIEINERNLRIDLLSVCYGVAENNINVLLYFII